MRRGALLIVLALGTGLITASPAAALGMNEGRATATTEPELAASTAILLALDAHEQPRREKDERGRWPWDWPGRVKDAVFGGVGDAINDWFKGIVQSALAPVFDLFSRTVFSTPELTSHDRVMSLWHISLGIADAALILFAVTGGGIVMSNGGVGARMTAKEVLPRLLLGAFAANASLLIVGQVTTISNSVSAAIVGYGGDPRSVADQLAKLVSGAFTNPFLALLGLVVVVLGLFVVAVFVLRIAALVVLIAGAPLLLVCHSLPHTEHLARLWWKATLGALAVPVAQALVLAAALKIVLSSEMLGLSSGGLVDLLVVSCLLYLIVKIPLLVANAVKSGSGSQAWARTKTVLVQTGKAVTPA